MSEPKLSKVTVTPAATPPPRLFPNWAKPWRRPPKASVP